jgi:hypothetical protein
MFGKSGSLNLLCPLGPTQACNGIVLSYMLIWYRCVYCSYRTKKFHIKTRKRMSCLGADVPSSGVPSNFVPGGGFNKLIWGQGRENGDLGAVAPWSGVPFNLQMSETRVLIRFLRMYFLQNWEFGSALSKLRNFRTPTVPRFPSGINSLFFHCQKFSKLWRLPPWLSKLI